MTYTWWAIMLAPPIVSVLLALSARRSINRSAARIDQMRAEREQRRRERDLQ